MYVFIVYTANGWDFKGGWGVVVGVGVRVFEGCLSWYPSALLRWYLVQYDCSSSAIEKSKILKKGPCATTFEDYGGFVGVLNRVCVLIGGVKIQIRDLYCRLWWYLWVMGVLVIFWKWAQESNIWSLRYLRWCCGQIIRFVRFFKDRGVTFKDQGPKLFDIDEFSIPRWAFWLHFLKIALFDIKKLFE